ncbi:MAG: hypothetical protein AAF432_11975 [Planctomycetota bacterium]
MAGRSSKTPLYEKLASAASRGSVSRGPDPRPDVASDEQSWLAPGRVVHMPVGYLFVGVAVVILAMIGTYAVGHHNGERTLRDDYMDRQFAIDADPTTIRDPLLEHDEQPGGSIVDSTISPPVTNAPFGSLEVTHTTIDAGPRAVSDWGPIESDPRQSGVNYFVLMETYQDGALRLVEFCRTRGLETYVISGKNTRLRKVIVLPGFEGMQRSSSAVKALEAKIRDVGLDWQAREGGEDNLSGAYPLLYQ